MRALSATTTEVVIRITGMPPERFTCPIDTELSWENLIQSSKRNGMTISHAKHLALKIMRDERALAANRTQVAHPMRRPSYEDLAREASVWAHTQYFSEVPAKGIPDYRQATRYWMIHVKRLSWIPALEDYIVQYMDRKGRKRAEERRKAEAERKRQGDLFK